MKGLLSLSLTLFVAVVTLSASLSSSAFAGAEAGRRLFADKKCAACHQIKGPAKERTIADQLKRKAPELWYSGSKFKAGFLEQWLQNPVPIRPMEYYSLTIRNRDNHVKLGAGEAAEVAAYLMSLRSSAVKPVGIEPNVDRRGRIIFAKKQSCYSCHRVLSRRGRVVGGLTGPSLIGAGNRLNPDWIFAYLADSAAFKPVKDMPEYSGILTIKEMAALAAYISTF